MNTTGQEALLQTYPALRALSPALLSKVGSMAVEVHAPAGLRLFGDGDACTHHPLVIEGRVRVAKSNSDGNEILLYRLGPGESCAITALTLLTSGRYPATGTAEEDVSAYALPGSLFLELTLESAEFRALVFNSVAERMAHLMALVESLAFRGVAKRLAAQLLQQEFTIETTHQTLADELGTRREVVSRILETFQQSGIVRLGRKRIEILDRQALASVG